MGALQAFATDIYYSSLEFGPENIRSAPSYFHMGRVFQSHQKADRTSAFYSKVVEIYTTFLENWFESQGGTAGDVGQNFEISAVEVEEAIEIIKHITEYREKRSGEDTSQTGQERSKTETAEGRYTLGLLFMYTGEFNVARDCHSSALDVFSSTLGIEHVRTKRCKHHLERIAEKQDRGGEQF